MKSISRLSPIVREHTVDDQTSGLIIPENELDEFVGRFLRSQDVRSNSRETYRRALRRFVAWFRFNHIMNPSREDILSYKSFLEGENLSPLTVVGYLVVVRKFFEWTESARLYPNVAKNIRGAKRRRGFHKDPLTAAQVKTLLSGIDRSTPEGLRDFALLNLLIRTGLRTIEAARANVGDIRQESGEAVLWIHGKGRDTKDDFVLLTDETLRPIRQHMQTRGATTDDSPLFTSLSDRNNGDRLTTRSVSRIAKCRLRGVGLESGRLSAHSLRHTAITLSLLGGATVQEAQILGRHADINTTLIYAHNINRVAHAPERKIDAVLAEVI